MPSPADDVAVWMEWLQEQQARRELVEPRNLGRPMAKPRRINWDRLAQESGVQTWRDPEGGTSTNQGTDVAKRALEILIGPDNIREAVRLVLRSPRGRQGACSVALSVLQDIRSLTASEMAYEEYKGSSGLEAAYAVGLIGDIAHPKALDWVGEFLNDPDVAKSGIRVLDQLAFRGRIDPDDERVQSALKLALKHKDQYVREQARQIRTSLRRLR